MKYLQLLFFSFLIGLMSIIYCSNLLYAQSVDSESYEKEIYQDEIERIRDLDFIDVPKYSSLTKPLYSEYYHTQMELREGALRLVEIIKDVFDGVAIEKKYDWLEAIEGDMPSCEIEDEQNLIYPGGGPCLTTSAWTIKANPNKYYGFSGIRSEIESLIDRSDGIDDAFCWSQETNTVRKCDLLIGYHGINIFFDEERPGELQVIVAW